MGGVADVGRFGTLTRVMELIEITDPADPRLDDFRDLSTADRRPDRPGGRGLVIAEGVIVIERLLASPYPVRSLLGVARRVTALAGTHPGCDAPAYVVSAGLMAEVVGFHLNRGVLAVADRAPAPGDPAADARCLAVLEGVGDHENLGAVFRNAAAFGVDGVVLGPGCSDPLYRRAVRVSMGHVLRVPFTPVDDRDWESYLDSLRRRGFVLAALTPSGSAVPLRSVNPAGRRVALLLGSEGHGLTERTLGLADVAVRIPMSPGVDSLNIATAAAVAFYEVMSSP